MCDELLAEVKQCPEVLAKDAVRKVGWKDPSGHLLTTDQIFCFYTYPFMREGINAPAPRTKQGAAAVRKKKRRSKRRNNCRTGWRNSRTRSTRSRGKLAGCRCTLLRGKRFRTKLYGEILIEKQESAYLVFTAEGKKREYRLPECITKGFLIPEDPEMEDRFWKEAEQQKEAEAISSEQRRLNMELRRIL